MLNNARIIVTIRDAADKIFSEAPYIISASSIHTWMQQKVFVPYEKALQRSKKGCKLDEFDLVYLSTCRAMLLAGARFALLTHMHFDRVGLSTKDNVLIEKAKKQGRGPQHFFEIHDYNIFAYVCPSPYRNSLAGEAIWFAPATEMDSQFKNAKYVQLHGQDRPNLEPHIFINVYAHSVYVQQRLIANGLK